MTFKNQKLWLLVFQTKKISFFFFLLLCTYSKEIIDFKIIIMFFFLNHFVRIKINILISVLNII